MSTGVLERVWDIYRYMHPDAPQRRREQLQDFLQSATELRPDALLREALAHLMELDRQKS